MLQKAHLKWTMVAKSLGFSPNEDYLVPTLLDAKIGPETDVVEASSFRGLREIYIPRSPKLIPRK